MRGYGLRHTLWWTWTLGESLESSVLDWTSVWSKRLEHVQSVRLLCLQSMASQKMGYIADVWIGAHTIHHRHGWMTRFTCTKADPHWHPDFSELALKLNLFVLLYSRLSVSTPFLFNTARVKAWPFWNTERFSTRVDKFCLSSHRLEWICFCLHLFMSLQQWRVEHWKSTLK